MSLPLVPFLLVFVLGIHFAFQSDAYDQLFDGVLCFILLIYFSFSSPFKWGLLLLGGSFFGLGIQAGKIDQKTPPSHYSQLVNPKNEATFQVLLQEKLSGSNTQERYYVTIKKVNDQAASGSLLLTVNKSEVNPLNFDHQWFIKGRISPLKDALNPGGFNYKNYLNNLKIYHQINSTPARITKGEKILFSFQKYNELLSEKLENSKLNQRSISFLQTILLGKRSRLDPSTREDFAKAGVFHLFAISGLHIGLLMLFFRTLFHPLTFLANGELWQTIAVLICLWCYALFVGGSASVIRAVTLFSAYQLGQNSGRKLPTAYLVLLSMGVLLFIRPNFILQLGFQMSYLAVFGILFISPLLHLKFENKILRWFWQLTTVSIAAQIAVAPLSIFHFHQFPGLFLVSNWVLLPLMGTFLYLGLIGLSWLYFFPFPLWFIWIEDTFVEQIFQFVTWIAGKENWLFDQLYLSSLTVFFIYLTLIHWIIYRHTKKILWGYSALVCLLCLYFNSHKKLQKQLWIAHQHKQTILVGQEDSILTFYYSDSLSKQSRLVQDYRTIYPHQKIKFQRLSNAYQINGISILVIDGPWVLALKEIPQGYWILHKNAKVNLARLCHKARPKKVIIDASSSPYYREQWIKTLEKFNLPYHITAKEGALVIL